MKTRKGKVLAGVMVGLCLMVLIMPQLFSRAGQPLDTYHQGWSLVRETAAEDGATFAAVYDLAANGGDFASKDSATVLLGGPFRILSKNPTQGYGVATSPGSRWQFIIAGGAAINDTFSFDIVAWAKGNGPLQVIATGNGVIGTQDVVLYPDDAATASSVWWADTLTLDALTQWTTTQGQPDLRLLNAGGANQIAVIEIVTRGIEWIQFVIYDALSAQGGEADPITVFGRRY